MTKKFIKPTEQVLNEVQQMTNCVFGDSLNYLPTINTVQKTQNRCYEVSCKMNYNSLIGHAVRYGIEKFTFQTETRIFEVPKHGAFYTGDIDLMNEADYTICINEFKDASSHEENSFYRFLIPVNDCDWITFFAPNCITTENGTMYGGYLHLNITDSFSIELFHTCILNQKYLVIDSTSECDKQTIWGVVYETVVALGLLTGTIHLGETYIITATDKDFTLNLGISYIRLRESSVCDHITIVKNKHFITELLNENNAYYALEQKYSNQPLKNLQIDRLYEDELVKLITMLRSNENLLRSAHILLDISACPLEYQSALYCVVLETICGVMKKNHKNNFEPLFDNKDWKNLRNAIQASICSLDLSDAQKETLVTKIDSLNRPTNADELKRPFEIFHYNLSSDEIDVLKQRNVFLHGHLNIKDDKNPFEELLHINRVLHKLCCILLFKEAGIHVYVANECVLYGEPKAISDQETALVEI